MIATNTHFHPHWIPSLTVLVLMVTFTLLGNWQLDRADQKQALAGTLQLRLQQPVIPVSHIDFSTTEPAELEFLRLRAAGRFLAGESVLIENRRQGGKTGFHIITPFEVSDTGRWLLVNRGWVEATAALSMPQFETPADELMLEGTVTLPVAPWLDLTPAADSPRISDQPARWPFFTLDRFRRWSGADIYPLLLLQSPESEGGFVRRWPQPEVDHSMHIGYALQWFGFAVIVLLIWVKLSLRDGREQG